ncbi:MAG TPA: helix-turn-helix domain-containing protein [Sphingomicrobium sp.]|nr:helix-turn-helix domain-containing protein [Sphingomicrobium sp.]
MNGAKPALPEVTVTAWARLMRAQRRGLSIVEGKLKDEGFPPLEWYDVLLELERRGPLRPRDLQATLLLAQSNLSRLLDRMVRAGLVERSSCPDDGRGLSVAITREGKFMRNKMWPAYAEGIAEAIGMRLERSEIEELARLLRLLIA